MLLTAGVLSCEISLLFVHGFTGVCAISCAIVPRSVTASPCHLSPIARMGVRTEAAQLCPLPQHLLLGERCRGEALTERGTMAQNLANPVERSRPPHHAPLPVWTLRGSPGRVVLPAGLANLWKCGSPHALSRLFARAGACNALFKRAKARRDMAEGLRPPRAPLPLAAIGRPLSRMPVIIRSHESSGESVTRLLRAGTAFLFFS
jgi:hypothetical protein